ncbi:hypothetical protein [Streptomyces niveiscabiei]|uniref:Uncharacterized protein n=1 Tax=Streptomyces niveiscabiei TaxID=164115 RepID=A0ABW9HZG0_9ACTN
MPPNRCYGGIGGDGGVLVAGNKNRSAEELAVYDVSSDTAGGVGTYVYWPGDSRAVRFVSTGVYNAVRRPG